MDRLYSQILLDRIKSLCKSRSITLNQLAVMSGVSHSTIQNLVNGSSKNPTVRTMHKFAIALNMTLAEFLDFQELNDYSFDEHTED